MSNRLNVINVAEGIDVIDSEYYSRDFAAIYLLRPVSYTHLTLPTTPYV